MNWQCVFLSHMWTAWEWNPKWVVPQLMPSWFRAEHRCRRCGKRETGWVERKPAIRLTTLEAVPLSTYLQWSGIGDLPAPRVGDEPPR